MDQKDYNKLVSDTKISGIKFLNDVLRHPDDKSPAMVAAITELYKLLI